MSGDLEDHYDNPVEQAMAEVASTVRIITDNIYDSDHDALFAALVRGLNIYVETWARDDDIASSLAGYVVNSEDLDDPDRINDPNAHFITLLGLTVDQLYENIRCELDPNYGGSEPDGSA